MRRLISMMGCITLVLVFLIIGGRVVGSQPSSAALARFQAAQCAPQPCWHNIRPGQTTLDDARTVLRRDPAVDFDPATEQWCWHGDPGLCWYVTLRSWSRDTDKPLNVIAIYPPANAVKLGDTLALFGAPLTSNLCWIAGIQDGDISAAIARPLAAAYLTFKGNLKVIAYNPQRPTLRQLDPNMVVLTIYYQAGYDIFTPRWQGFTSPARWGCNRG
ncbi:MAG: hypothetical protein IT324_25130 [Anaerolineae bacterium]|nr:hypothetical protein [Anaerolineae bacterium]